MSTADIAACVQKASEVCAQPSQTSQDHFVVIVGAIVACFGSLMVFLGIVIPVVLNRAKRAEQHAQAASFGINNHHKENFRDDFDKFKREVFLLFGDLKGKIESLDGRVDRVEDTQEGRYRHAADKRSR